MSSKHGKHGKIHFHFAINQGSATVLSVRMLKYKYQPD